MNMLDENILKDQRQQLLQWRVPIRHIGYDIGRMGMKDSEIIPLLLQLRRPTFFTLDLGFYKRTLCHARYCLVCMAIVQQEAATFVRRFLRHQAFNTQAKRMGTAVRLSSVGLSVWRLHTDPKTEFAWEL